MTTHTTAAALVIRYSSGDSDVLTPDALDQARATEAVQRAALAEGAAAPASRPKTIPTHSPWPGWFMLGCRGGWSRGGRPRTSR